MKKLPVLTLVGVLLLLTAVTAAADTLYTVQNGDTLAAIARRFSSTVQTLVQRNNIANPDLIYSGQQLVVPDANGAPAPPPPSPTGDQTRYTVQRGDTLASIARRFGTTVLALVQANNIGNPNLIYVGRVLVIPGTGSAPTPPPPADNPPTPLPPSPPAPTGANLLPNGSFEAGWYNLNGVPELQLPNQWLFEWDEGPTGFGTQPWDVYVRPETRVLPAAYLPPNEHGLFIWDGNQTVKIFKGRGAISYRLLTDVVLAPGTYRLTVNLFPDLVTAVNGTTKVWAASDAGEVAFVVGGQRTAWQQTAVGQRNTLSHTFTVSQNQTVRLGVAIRGRYAILNNGWFMDDWSLRRTQ